MKTVEEQSWISDKIRQRIIQHSGYNSEPFFIILISLLDFNSIDLGLAIKVHILVLLSTLTVREVKFRTIRKSHQEILIGECDFYLKEEKK